MNIIDKTAPDIDRGDLIGSVVSLRNYIVESMETIDYTLANQKNRLGGTVSQEDMAAMSRAVAALSSSVTSLANQTAALFQQVNGIAQTVSGLSDQAELIETELQSLEARVAALESAGQ